MTPPKETTIIQPALLPCPFCGGEAHLYSPRLPMRADCDDVQVSCGECDTAGPSILFDQDVHGETDLPDLEAEAIAAWNTRVQPAPVEQDVERLWPILRAQCTPATSWHDVDGWKYRARFLLSILTPARAEGFKAGVDQIRAAGLALLTKLDAAMPHIENAVKVATNHHCPYQGEPIGEALEAFRQALVCKEGG